MRSVEATGKTVDEATAAAARELGVPADQLVVEVLEEPKKLLAFLGGHEVRIRATDEQAAADTGAEPPAAAAEAAAPAVAADSAAAEQPTSEAPTAEAVGRLAFESVSQILTLMGVRAEATLGRVDEEEVAIDITGADAALLIGRHGVTLDALQLIVAVIANRGHARGTRIILDAEGYRERREQMLRRMAQSHAARVKEAGKEIVITDLKPYERRIVHLTLKDDPDVETYSEGEGEDRHIVISPRVS